MPRSLQPFCNETKRAKAEMKLARRLVLAGFGNILLLVVACEPKQTAPPPVDIGKELHFQALESTEGQLHQYQSNNPTYFLILDRDEIVQLNDWVSESAIGQLNA